MQREVSGQRVILPVWHNVTYADVAKYSLPLADRFTGSTLSGTPKLAEQLITAMEGRIVNNKLQNQKLYLISPAASLDIKYDRLRISDQLHRYSLTVRFTLEETS